jgi:hypothetical protein
MFSLSLSLFLSFSSSLFFLDSFSTVRSSSLSTHPLPPLIFLFACARARALSSSLLSRVLSSFLRLAQVPYPVERIVEQPVIKEVEVIREVPVVIEKTVEKVVTKEVCL